MKYLIHCLLFCLPACLWTQPNSSDSLWRLAIEDMVVTAQYVPTHVSNAVHQVKVIKGTEVEQQGQNNLAEVLTNQLNLNVNVDPILGNGVQIQGVGGENVLIMIDGVPVIGRTNGNIDLSQITMNNVEQIEIIEGAMSAQYGSNASGGVVNIITKKSQLDRFSVKAINQYENVGILNNAFSLGFQQDKWYANLNLNRFASQLMPTDSLRLFETRYLDDGTAYRTKKYPWNPKVQLGMDGTLRYDFSDSTQMIYQYRYFDEELGVFGETRRPQFRPYSFDQYFTTRRVDHSLRLETYLGPRLYYQATTAFNVYDRLRRTERLDLEPDTTSLVPGGQDTTLFTALLHRGMLSTLSSGKWNGQLGGEIFHETGAGQRIQDPENPDSEGASLSNYAAWLSTRFNPTGGLTIQGNLRYGYNTRYEHPLVPSLNVHWQPTEAWSLRLSYARGFRAPSLKELFFNFVDVNHFIIGNPGLEAERSQNAAFNVAYTPQRQGAVGFSGKLFYNRISNRIITAEFAPLQFNYQNLEQFETHGLNLKMDWSGKHWRISSGFAFTRLYNQWAADYDESPGFTNLSEWQNELNVQLAPIDADLVVVHRYLGRQVRFFENEAGQLQQGFIGDYHFVNATLSRHLWQERIFLALGGKNLLNITSVPANVGGGGSAHGGVGNSQLLNWGRTFFVRINFKFGF